MLLKASHEGFLRMFLLFLVILLLARRKFGLSFLKERSKAKTQLGPECCTQQYKVQLESITGGVTQGSELGPNTVRPLC